MKKFLKIFFYLLIALLSFVVIAVIVISLSQNKILEITQKQITKTIQTPVDIEDLSFTIFKQFPYATVELSGVKILSHDSIQTNPSKPSSQIANIKSLYISIQSLPLLKGIYEVENLEISDAQIAYSIDSMGKSNIDFLLEQESQTEKDSSSHMFLNLEQFKISNTILYYSNDTMQLKARVYFPKLDIQAKFENESLTATLKGNMQISDCSFGESNLYKMEQADLLFNIDYDSDSISINKLELSLDKANISTSGILVASDSLYTKLDFEIKKANVGELVKYVPEKILEDTGIKQIDGTAKLSGNIQGIYSEHQMPMLNFSYNFSKGLVETRDYPALRNIESQGEFSNIDLNNLSIAKARINKLYVESDSSSADIVLSAQNFKSPAYEIKSELILNIAEFAEYVPDTLVQDISGEIKAEFLTSGKYPKTFDDKFINEIVNRSSGNFKVSNLNLRKDTLQIKNLSVIAEYKPGHLKLESINASLPQWNLNLWNSSFNTHFTGIVTDLKSINLEVTSFVLESEPGEISGSAKVKNLEKPCFELDVEAQIKLEEIKPFIPDSILSNLSGEIDSKFNSYGCIDFDSIEYQMNNILFNQSIIDIEARNFSASMPDTIQNVTNINGKIKLTKENISIPELSGTAANIDFVIDSAAISNYYSTVIESQNKDTLNAFLSIQLGEIKSSHLEPFINLDTAQQAEKNQTDGLSMNFPFDVKGKFAVKSIHYDKIFLKDISAKFHLSDSTYIVDQLKTKAFDGSTINSMRYDLTKDNRKVIHINNQVDNMDVNKLLFAFDDFAYDSIMSYKNLSGIFSTNINSRFVFVNDSLRTNDMRVLGEFKLKNGNLVNYTPAMEISKFTGIKELDDIEMKTLNCNIFMFKNQIFVPITKIVSSAMDVSTFGMQSLDENYEYHLQLHLGEILKGKSQKLFERQAQTGDEVNEEDLKRNTIKLIYGYNDGKKKIGFATKRAQKKMELKIKVQQKMLELIFHPLLVSYETGVQ